MPEFQIESFQNEFLPQGGQVMHAVVTVCASGTGAASGPAQHEERTELLIVDTSGSMNGKKLRSAKAATAAAIDCIPTGVRFGVITGNHEATLAVALDVSTPESRQRAKEAVKQFEAGGGTAIGSWIRLAATVLAQSPGIRHAILLTDGKNESEDPWILDEALAEAEGALQCDCRGVGDSWDVGELRKVATALRGDYDIVATPEGLEADFSGLMRASLLRQVAEVSLRVWTPQGAEVVALKQMDPPLDLTGSRAVVGPLVGDYTTGSWGDECRDYYLSVRVPPGEVDDKMLAARVTLVVGDEPAGQALVTVEWTDDVAKSTRMNKRVAEAIGEGELADVIQEGVDAYHAGDVETATNRFGRAVRLANDSGNDEAMERLSKLVEIDDPVTGRVRPKAKVEKVDVMTLETRSTRTSRTSRPGPGEAT
ncbi:MAG: VWA domain-containing protein [Acidimicrobiales bacterium]